MKILALIFGMFLSCGKSFAQNSPGVVDTGARGKNVVFRCIGSNTIKNGALFVVDGTELADSSAKKTINNINPKNILEYSILKDDSGRAIYDEKGKNPFIIIVTRQYAISQYQKKLSAFSEAYKKRIEFQMRYNHDDDGLMYLILKNGKLNFFHGDEKVRALYDIPTANIISVDYTEQQTCCGTNRFVTVAVNQ